MNSVEARNAYTNVSWKVPGTAPVLVRTGKGNLKPVEGITVEDGAIVIAIGGKVGGEIKVDTTETIDTPAPVEAEDDHELAVA